MHVFSNDDKARFWEKVDVQGPDDCWLWMNGVSGGRQGGYGTFKIGGKWVIYSHRAVLMMDGIDPTGQIVRHMCQPEPNRRCCNPRHLLLGSHWDNVQDMVLAGRNARMYGELNGRAAFSDREAIAVLNTPHATRPQVEAAFGVSRRTVERLRRRETYTHLL